MEDTIERKTALAAAEWWGARLQTGDVEKFKSHIAQEVEAKLSDGAKFVHLTVDYDPWDIMLDAVHAAGLECRGNLFSADGILPRKHTLTVEPGLLRPKEGYGNWTDDIKVT